MKKSVAFYSLCLIIIFKIHAQEPVYKTYNWDEIMELPEECTEEKLILKKTEIDEFIFENEFFIEYQLRHGVEYINSDEQVQLNNKKYLPYSESSELVEAKIRVVNPEKEVITLESSKILTSIDEVTGQHYKYFALEGLEPGSIIDFLYVLKKYPSYNGTRKFIQDEFTTKEYNFELYCPPHLEFMFKVYNDTSNVKLDTTYKEKNRWSINLKEIEALKEEEMSPYNGLLKQLVYKLDKNVAAGNRDISSFGTASSIVYNNIFQSLDKKDENAVNKLIKKIDLTQNLSTEDKIIKIEDYVKDNIGIVNTGSPEYSKISSIVDLKSSTEMGIIKLLANLYRFSDIDFEIVLTSDRTNIIFDPEFESFHYLNDYLIYFPETNKYIAPDLFEYRYNIIPWEFTDNYGLFIKEIGLGDYKTGIGKVKYIEPLNYDINYHNINAEVNILPDFSTSEITFELYASGYYSVNIQPYYPLFNEENKKDYIEENFNYYFKESEILSWSVENAEAGFVGKKPYIEKYEATTSELIESAGSNYLFMVGKLIGRQVEMYSEDERKLPVNDPYKRSFQRKLSVKIPEGYSIENPEDVVYSVSYIKDGNKINVFESDYVINDQTITININEYYDQINYSLDEYPQYRNVVNAAANFEKAVLIIKKN